MAGKLISLEEAAQSLGITTNELLEMRLSGQAFGIRDGSGWKFRQDDIDQMIADRAGSSGDLPVDLSGSSSALDLPLDFGDAQDNVILSERELGVSGSSGGSTVIGGKKDPSGEDDIELKFGSGLNLLDGSGTGGDKNPPAAPAAPASGISGLNLAGTSGLDLLGSDVKLAPSTSGIAKADSSNVLAGGSSGAGGSDAGKTMLTAELADKPAPSGIKLTLRDSESVFESPDSDLTRNIQGSGINLLDSADSGLALDDLQLAPSAIGKKKSAGASDLELKGDDDFLLTPLEEQTEDSTDSGSQVIALEGDFGDDATATLMAGDVPGLGAMLEADGLSPLGSGAPAGGMGMGMPIYAPPPEPSYGIGTVLALGVSSILMTLVGIMMYDIIRNMWSWDTPYSFSSTLMDMILKAIG